MRGAGRGGGIGGRCWAGCGYRGLVWLARAMVGRVHCERLATRHKLQGHGRNCECSKAERLPRGKAGARGLDSGWAWLAAVTEYSAYPQHRVSIVAHQKYAVR